MLKQVFSAHFRCYFEVARPRVYGVLAAFQCKEVAELQLNLTKVLIHDRVHLHIPITARHPVGVEAVFDPQHILWLQEHVSKG